MKIAVLSDIHGNLEALTACVARANDQGVEAFVGLGDFVNYGADPGPTLDALMALPGFIAVIGNHDEAMFRETRWPRDSEVEHAAAWTRDRLSAAHLAFLRELHYVRRAHGVAFAHAAFDFPDNWEYVVKPRQARKCFRAVTDRLLFMGHVHVPAIFRQGADGAVDEIGATPGIVHRFVPGLRYLVNVGSVGQPRDENPEACFVIYDKADASVRFERVTYDVARAADKIRAAGLHPFYADRLARGQ